MKSFSVADKRVSRRVNKRLPRPYMSAHGFSQLLIHFCQRGVCLASIVFKWRLPIGVTNESSAFTKREVGKEVKLIKIYFGTVLF